MVDRVDKTGTLGMMDTPGMWSGTFGTAAVGVEVLGLERTTAMVGVGVLGLERTRIPGT